MDLDHPPRRVMPAPFLQILTEYCYEFGPYQRVWVAHLYKGSFPWLVRMAPTEAGAYGKVAEYVLAQGHLNITTRLPLFAPPELL